MNKQMQGMVLAAVVFALLSVAITGEAWAGQPPQGGRADFRQLWGRMINVSEEFALLRLPADTWIVEVVEPGAVVVDPQPNTCLVQSNKAGSASLASNARGSTETYELSFSARVRLTDPTGNCVFGLASDDPAKASILVESDGKELWLRMKGGAKEEATAVAPFDAEWHTFDLRVTKERVTLEVDNVALAEFDSAPPTAALAAVFLVKPAEDSQIEIDRVRLSLTPPGLRDRRGGGGGGGAGGGRPNRDN